MMKRIVSLGRSMPEVMRLGLATRGNTRPTAEDISYALERGINYWNWCGHEDGMSRAIRELGPRRSDVVIATQIGISDWSRDGMWRKLDRRLADLDTDWLDVVTLYYVESQREWSQIVGDQGALRALEDAKKDGRIRAIGLTTHQRDLAANWVQSGLLDLLMIRYNAAHRKAETHVFPICEQRNLPVVCFTCLRWGALLKATGSDPEDFEIPPAAGWYRYVLSHPLVSVALMAPDNRKELLENLALLDDWRAVTALEREQMELHGDRVRLAAGPFP